MELEKGDSLYIFSDGYLDQFGGEKGKKFKPTNLHKLLLSIQNQ
jgi:serine phosphatase RsbU (regulator of sigma subunit)